MAWIDGVGSCIFSGLVISQNKPLSVPNKERGCSLCFNEAIVARRIIMIMIMLIIMILK